MMRHLLCRIFGRPWILTDHPSFHGTRPPIICSGCGRIPKQRT